jgi:tetratricopeptide (TPR) repeat protein
MRSLTKTMPYTPLKLGDRMATMVRRIALAAALAAICLHLPAPAAAQGTAAASEALFLEGVAKFKSGDRKGAIASLEKALKSGPHPTLLFNLAVLNDLEGHNANAAKYYGQYVRTNPEDAALVMARWAQIAPAKAEAYAKSQEVVEPGPEASGEAVAASAEAPPPPAAAGGEPGVLTYVMLGAGVVGVAAGGAFGALTVSDVNSFLEAEVRGDAKKHRDNAESHQMMANIAFGIGGAALVTGVILLIAEASAGSSGDGGSAAAGGAGDASIAPVITPNGMGAAYRLAF